MRLFGLPFCKQRCPPFDEQEYSNPHLKGCNLNYQKFIILATSRTGSGYLVSLLKSHSQVISFSELFGPKNINFLYQGYPEHDSEKLMAFRNTHPIEFLNKTVFRKYAPGISAVGFKIFYHHATNGKLAGIWPYFKKLPGLKIIHLKRKNLLKSFLSSKIAEKTNVWKIYDSAQSTNDIKIKLGYEECLDYFMKIEKNISQYDIFFNNKLLLEVFYENLTGNCPEEINRIQKFLNLNLEALKSPFKKQNNQLLSETILDYWELKEKFKDTCWIRFFED